ncbi:MAG: hypothetical protein SGILL_000827 [Bacillariaceae sp.]
MAIKIFREALFLARKRCQDFAVGSVQHAAVNKLSGGGARIKRVRTQPAVCLNMKNGSATQQGPNDHFAVGVHAAGLLMTGSIFCHDNEFEDAKCAAAIIVFNLASSFHMKSLSGSGCQREMEKAKSLYVHAYDIVSSTISRINGNKGRFSATGATAIDFLYMALLNNMAYAELDIFGNHSRSSMLFHRLACVAVSVRETLLDQGSRLEHDQIERYLQNAIFARMSKLITAPAA